MSNNSPHCESVETPLFDLSEPVVNDELWTNRRASERATCANRARWRGGRRQFVDPTTCERDYTKAELEFMQAMHEYKQRSGRPFPTWSEVLEVLNSLGYQKFGTTGGRVQARA